MASAAARKRRGGPPKIDDEFRSRVQASAMFSMLEGDELEKLFGGSERLLVKPNEPLLPEIDPQSFQRSGPTPIVFIIEGEAKVHGVIDGNYRVLNYVQRQELFYSRTYDRDERAALEMTSMSPVDAIAMPARVLDKLLNGNPHFKEGFLAQLKIAKERKGDFFKSPAAQRVSAFLLDERLTPTNRVKFLRYDKCVECSLCYDACASRHGVSRLWPSETARLGVLSVPDNCHNCHYPTCEPACRFDVLRYEDTEAELRVSHNCVGCQQCAKNCSYGSITMVPFNMIDPI